MSNAVIDGQTTVELLAGQHPSGEMVVERVLVTPQSENDSFLLLKSPVFVRGIARGDTIQKMAATDDTSPKGAFRVLKHGGNLCVRVFSKENNDTLEQALTSELEKLGGDLDVHEQRVLVYSIHVSCGFTTVEKILDDLLKTNEQVNWLYGNVYDPANGEPLNWWQPILSPDEY
ncbi:MAG: hypothetical protein ACJA0N_000438 [Pseudohongiellaceae bacterium]|jgi:hypothetical protein